jgi:alanyl-tRNA synthetase
MAANPSALTNCLRFIIDLRPAYRTDPSESQEDTVAAEGGRPAMIEQIFQTDARVREFDARIVSSDPEAATVGLDRTAFYPGGGGQPCDLGRLEWEGGRAEVIAVRRKGPAIELVG